MAKTDRPKSPEQRITIANVADWQDIRARHDEMAMDPGHMSNHIVKAHGYVADAVDKLSHGIKAPPIEEKRLADLIISSIWAVRALGYDPAQLVANRMWEIGIKPKQDELPPSERAICPHPANPCYATTHPHAPWPKRGKGKGAT